MCVGSGTRVELQRFGCVACASPVSLVVERVLVCFFWLNEPGGANDICFLGVEAASESEFGVAGAIVSGSCNFCVFHREQYWHDRSKNKPYYL